MQDFREIICISFLHMRSAITLLKWHNCSDVARMPEFKKKNNNSLVHCYFSMFTGLSLHPFAEGNRVYTLSVDSFSFHTPIKHYILQYKLNTRINDCRMEPLIIIVSLEILTPFFFASLVPDSYFITSLKSRCFYEPFLLLCRNTIISSNNFLSEGKGTAVQGIKKINKDANIC